jgi:hypothetical protein
MRKKCADEKQLVQLKFGLLDCQPLALFALCTGASSDPMVLAFTPAPARSDTPWSVTLTIRGRSTRSAAAGVHGEERDGGAGARQAGVPAGDGGGAQVQEEGVPAAPRRAVRPGGVPVPRRRPPVGAARGGRRRRRPGAAGRRRPAGRGRPAQGRAGRRVAPVRRQVPVRLRQEHGRQATLLVLLLHLRADGGRTPSVVDTYVVAASL